MASTSTSKELDVGMKCIKYMLCVSNLMFVIVGILLISIGYTVKTIYSSFDAFMESYYYHPSSIVIVIGFFIFGIACLGCVGALKESTFLVNLYAFFLTLVLILQISASIAAYAMRANIEDAIYNNMFEAMENYNEEYNAFAWNSTQYNLHCCGIYKYYEWNQYNETEGFKLQQIVLENNTSLYVPSSCCIEEICSLDSGVYSTGCLTRLSFIVSQCALLLGVGALCVAFIQALGVVFASMLAKSIRKVKTQRLVAREQRRRDFYDVMLKNQELNKTTALYTPKETDA